MHKKSGARAKREHDSLTQAEEREITRRVKDDADPNRFVLVSLLGRQFALYYNVSEDSYGWNDPEHATLFKRRRAAEAVQRSLRAGIEVIACRVNRTGRIVARSVKLPRSVKAE